MSDVDERKRAFISAVNELSDKYRVNYVAVVDASDVDDVEPYTAFRHNIEGTDELVLRWAAAHLADTADAQEKGQVVELKKMALA